MAYDNTKAISSSYLLKDVYARVLHRAGFKLDDGIDPGEIINCIKRAINRLYNNAYADLEKLYTRRSDTLTLAAGEIDASTLGLATNLVSVYSGTERYHESHNWTEFDRVTHGLTGSESEGARKYMYLPDEKAIMVRTGTGITGESSFIVTYVREANVVIVFADIDAINKIDVPDKYVPYVEIAAAFELRTQKSTEMKKELQSDYMNVVQALDQKYLMLEKEKEASNKE